MNEGLTLLIGKSIIVRKPITRGYKLQQKKTHVLNIKKHAMHNMHKLARASGQLPSVPLCQDGTGRD